MKHLLYLSLLPFLAACASSPTHQPEKKAGMAHSITIGAVGDIFMGGSATVILEKEGYDYPFIATKPLYAGSDIVIANLEGPLTSKGIATPNKKYVYKSPADKVTPALKKAGLHIVTLANNHSMDYGTPGLKSTITSLDKYQIAHIGAGETLTAARQAYIYNNRGFKVGFLGYSLTFPEDYWADEGKGGTAFAREEQMRDDLKQLRDKTDAIVVSFHWGRELETELRPYQTRMGHMAIDEGATLVIGHHPHIMQGVEIYKNGLILHSLGNYTFGSYSNNVQYGGLANIELDRRGFKSLQLNIIDINNFRQEFQPKPMKNKRLTKALKEIKKLSQLLNTELLIQADTLNLSR